MQPTEHDVYVSYQRETGADFAEFVAASLKKRGFRVLVGSREAADSAANLAAIESAPDFVVLLSPGSLDPAAQGDDVRTEVSHAIAHERNIVPMYVQGYVRPQPGELPVELAAFPWRDAVEFDPQASQESVAKIAHMLASDTSVGERSLDRQARRLFITLGLGLLAVASVELARTLPKLLARPLQEPPPLPPLSIAWTGFGERLQDGRWVEFTLANGSQVYPGDQIKFAFSVPADAHAYVLTTDLRGEVSVLFPPRAVNADSQIKAAQVYEAPFDGSWFSIEDPEGLRGIYLMASYDPIENVEAIVEERDEETTPRGRRSLVESTIAGLVDGRHNQAQSHIRTRHGNAIVQNLELPPGPNTAQTTLASGLRVVHPLTVQPGLMSVVAEIGVLYERPR
jgi:hypothetical protein